MTDLPEGWAETSLDVIADWGSGGTPDRRRPDFFGGEIPWVKTGELREAFIEKTEENLTEAGLQGSSAKIFPKGSVAIAMYGATIGRTAIFGISAATNQACAVAVPKPSVTISKFVFYYLASIKRSLVAAGKGGAQPNISQGLLREWPIQLPPLPEQKRIVAKVEELFSELDAGEENLIRARGLLGLYRQSLLKAAFQGDLTAAWREANKDKLEPPETLLARIRQERETRYAEALDAWQTALSEWRAGGEKGRKPGKPSRPGEITNVVPPEILMGKVAPEWTWLRLGDLAEVAGGLTKNPKRSSLSKQMKYLRVGNVYADRLNLEEISEIGVTEAEFENNQVKLGDLLVVEGNGSVDQIGRVAIWNGAIDEIGHQNHLIRVRLDEGLLPRYVLSFLMSPLGRDLIVQVASSTSGLHTLSISKVSALLIPIAPLPEQQVIVQILDTQLSAIDATEAEITTALAKIAALRQSILKEAFSGRLVPQDPKDEPAAALLARLKPNPVPARSRKPRT